MLYVAKNEQKAKGTGNGDDERKQLHVYAGTDYKNTLKILYPKSRTCRQTKQPENSFTLLCYNTSVCN